VLVHVDTLSKFMVTGGNVAEVAGATSSEGLYIDTVVNVGEVTTLLWKRFSLLSLPSSLSAQEQEP